jgi:hypothetical protein
MELYRQHNREYRRCSDSWLVLLCATPKALWLNTGRAPGPYCPISRSARRSCHSGSATGRFIFDEADHFFLIGTAPFGAANEKRDKRRLAGLVARRSASDVDRHVGDTNGV